MTAASKHVIARRRCLTEVATRRLFPLGASLIPCALIRVSLLVCYDARQDGTLASTSTDFSHTRQENHQVLSLLPDGVVSAAIGRN